MRIIIQKLYNQNGQETGSILSAISPYPVTLQLKNQVEIQLAQYAHNFLYPNIGINIYSEMHNDTIAITVIKNINNLPDTDISKFFNV